MKVGAVPSVSNRRADRISIGAMLEDQQDWEMKIRLCVFPYNTRITL